MKDVSMAQDAGVIDVWAAYGYAPKRPEYELLKRVTHWSKDDVERERLLSQKDVLVAWIGFWVLDRHWYHRLLIGAVQHGQAIENSHKAALADLGLTNAISKASHVFMDTWTKRIVSHLIGTAVVFAVVTGPIWLLRRDLFTSSTLGSVFVASAALIAVWRWAFLKDWKIRARHRIDFFYGSVAIMLFILAWAANTAVKPAG